MSECKFGGNQRRICYESKCKPCYLRCFASHPKSKYILDVDPRKIALQCNKKFWFKCNKCSHKFDIRVSDVTAKNRWCPYCCIPQQKLCKDLDCNHCYNRSLASHWSAEFIIDADPRQIMLMSHKKYWFNCNKCKHKFEIAIYAIVNNKSWCCYCGNKRLCEDACNYCYNKSLASHDKGQYVMNTDPRQIFSQSNNMYDFGCQDCKNIFNTTPYSVTGLGTWCPLCRNKTELIVLNFLKSLNLNINTQYKMFGNYKYDFFLLNYNLIIEVDGEQHFKQVSNWKSYLDSQKNDKIKMDYLVKNKISLIRILQTDIYYNKYNWQKELTKYIDHAKNNFFFMFLDEDDIYSNKHLADEYFHLHPKMFKIEKIIEIKY